MPTVVQPEPFSRGETAVEPSTAIDAQQGGTQVATLDGPDLETLVDGVNQVGAIDKKIRFLRRIPKDPMTDSTEWGLRSLQDDPNSLSWGRQNVFDVYTTSEAVGLDDTAYNTW